MSRLVKIQLYNFECFDFAEVEFDSRNIIVLKGYNDSGKTAINNSQKVLLYNGMKSEQVNMIKEGADYFRILDYFDDGVVIMFDKYSNGSSVYTLYKDGFKDENILFTTVQNGVAVPFDGVPEPISDYLGVGSYKNIYLNVRERNDKMLLTDTSGSDNYKFITSVLHTDELVLASTMLNTDKNNKQAEINSKASVLSVKKSEYNDLFGITENLVNYTERLDKDIDAGEFRQRSLENISAVIKREEEIKILPELHQLNGKRLKDLKEILLKLNDVKEPVLDNLEFINSDRCKILLNIVSRVRKLGSLVVLNNIDHIDTDRLKTISSIQSVLKSVADIDRRSVECNAELDTLKERLNQLSQEISKYGNKVVKCDNCGSLVSVEESKVAM